MSNSFELSRERSQLFRVGTRASRLARIQTDSVVQRLGEFFPELFFEILSVATPGDFDLVTDLRGCPDDYFSCEIDQSVLAGSIDFAVHSAKDMPQEKLPGIDWCYLPWKEDPRDCLVFRTGYRKRGIDASPVVGISSDRRAEYVKRRFSNPTLKSLRGDIESRLRQLDAGDFDVVVMAAAALLRLGRQDRIDEWISISELATPRGQGTLAITFRRGDPFWTRMRALWVNSVVFAGAGTGSRENCTLATWEALQQCDVCLHDTVLDTAILEYLPPGVRSVDVGKRCGKHTATQDEINQLLLDEARSGARVVRLKGGDPGVFGRLSEELNTLDELKLPYRVIPGVSALGAATTGTGMLLTERSISSGFTVLTPRRQQGARGAIGSEMRAELPLVLFMSVGVLREVAQELIEDGRAPTTPAAVVFDAGSAEEEIIQADLCDIGLRAAAMATAPPRPGLVIVGSPASQGHHPWWGALAGQRVLLTCSEALQSRATQRVRDLGGIAVQQPLIRLAPVPGACEELQGLSEYDGVVVSSPSAAEIFMQMLGDFDLRRMPPLMVAGPGTAAVFHRYHIHPEFVPPQNYGAEALAELAKTSFRQGASLMRLRSDIAGEALASVLRTQGFEVRERVLYRNERVQLARLPRYDAVFFASSSAVHAFAALEQMSLLNGKRVVVIGEPTRNALLEYGFNGEILAPEASVDSAIEALAAAVLRDELKEML
jgi:uroporphyrinogen III methyltransferase / synthase